MKIIIIASLVLDVISRNQTCNLAISGVFDVESELVELYLLCTTSL